MINLLRSRPVRSFVLREGRLTSGQKRALEDHSHEFVIRSTIRDFGAVFPVPEQPLVLEVGFGMGDSLLAMALAYPHYNFIGVEVHRPGVGHLLHLAQRNQLRNLRILIEDARPVVEFVLAEASLDQVQVFFPDPWPKKRHHKRRLVDESFIESVARVLKNDGLFHFVTDVECYAESVRALLRRGSSQFCQGSVKLARMTTKYEDRAIRLGNEVSEVCYRKASVRQLPGDR